MIKRRTLLFFGFLLFFLALTKIHSEPVFRNLEGEKISWSSLKGKWVFINYWAGWCDSCIKEIPELNRFYLAHQKTGQVAVFAVNYDALPVEQQQDLVKQYKLRYPSLRDNPARELKLGAVAVVPLTFVFNPHGKLVERVFGPLSVKKLDAILSNHA